MIKQNILIVEDEVLIANQLKNAITKQGYKCMGIAISYDQAIQYLTTTNVNAVLLDINIFGNKSGTDLGNVLKKQFNIPFIYLTSYTDETTIKALKGTNPNGYIVKPVNDTMLTTNLDLLFANQKETTSDTINFKAGRTNYRVVVSELMYIKSDGNYLELNFTKEVKLIRFSLTQFLELLPQNSLFKINRRVAVNPKFIVEKRNKDIKMTSGDIFKISSLLKESLPF